MFKRFILLLSLTVLLIPLIPNLKVMAATQAPDKPIEVSCPPSYAGEKKCYYVSNPKTTNVNTVVPEVNIPQKVVKTTKDGINLTSDSVLWSFSTFSNFLNDGIDTSVDFTKSFWGDVTNTSQKVNNVANKISDSTAEALQNAVDISKKTGEKAINLPLEAWNDLFDNVKNEFETDSEYAQKTQDRFKESYKGTEAELPFNTFEMNQNSKDEFVTLRYNKKVNETWIYTVRNDNGRYKQATYLIRKDGSLRGISVPDSYSLYPESIRKKIFDFLLDNDDFDILPPKQASLSDIGKITAMGVAAPVLPMIVGGSSKIVEVDGQKYVEVENPISPAHPDLKPLPQIQETGKTTLSPNIPGHTLIDQDGNAIDQTTGSIVGDSPITTPVTNPLTPGTPGYAVPVPPTPPGNTTDKCIKCLPELVPNFFGLFNVFFIFLGACLAYLFKLLAFIMSIPLISAKQFPGPAGETFAYIKNLSIGNIALYDTMLSLVALLLSFAIYKMIKRMF